MVPKSSPVGWTTKQFARGRLRSTFSRISSDRGLGPNGFGRNVGAVIQDMCRTLIASRTSRSKPSLQVDSCVVSTLHGKERLTAISSDALVSVDTTIASITASDS